MTQEPAYTEPSELGKLLLSMGIALLQAGTGSGKVVTTLLRVASSYQYGVHVEVSTRSLTISLHRHNEDHILFNGSRIIHGMPGVNFNTLASVSALSWEVREKSLTVTQTKEALEKILKQPGYPRLLVLTMVGLASSAFCFTFGGDAFQMLITFVASFVALWVRQELTHKHVNPFVITFFSSSIGASIVAVFHLTGAYPLPIQAFTTCCLFLIPGVPMINAFIESMDGYILNGIDRIVASLMHSFAIAAGLSIVIFVLKIL
jgi:uncharacterized membrane protein YjjP (DUF1212 family)